MKKTDQNKLSWAVVIIFAAFGVVQGCVAKNYIAAIYAVATMLLAGTLYLEEIKKGRQ